MAKYKKAQKVQWKTPSGIVDGTVEEFYNERTTRVFKGKSITLNGRKGNPVYVLRSTAGDQALKLESELTSPEASK